MSETAGTGSELVFVEGARPLSESVLWRVHDTYFEESGVAAWASGDVPHAVTTGPVLARSYARMIEGLVDDCRAGRFGPVDPAAPVYLVEVGAGSGRLGFQVLSALDRDRLEPFEVVYVLTDRARANVEFWSSNRRLASFVAEARLDFAQFDPTRDRTLRLEQAGVELAPGTTANPMVVITNYLFDVLPQDLFAVLDGRLHEELVEVYLDDDAVTETSADYFDHVRFIPHWRSVDGARYDDRNDLLLRDASALRGGGDRLLFPVAGVVAVDCMLQLAGGRLLWLIGERPPRRLRPVDEAGGRDHPAAYKPGPIIRMGIHGRSISFPPDLNVLAAAAGADRGVAELLLPREPAPAFLAAALVVGDGGAGDSTRAAYRFAVDELAPELVSHVLKRALVDRGEGAGLFDLLAALRMSRHDPRVFDRCLPGFAKCLPLADREAVDQAVDSFRKVLRLDYPLAEGADLAGSIARLLAASGRDEDASWFFDRSVEWAAPDPGTLCEMARCRMRLGSSERAAELAGRALALDASCEEAESVLNELRETTATVGS